VKNKLKFTGLKKTSRKGSTIFVYLFLSGIFQEEKEAAFACGSKKQVWVGITPHSREPEFWAGGIADSSRAHILNPAGENAQQKEYGLVKFITTQGTNSGPQIPSWTSTKSSWLERRARRLLKVPYGAQCLPFWQKKPPIAR